MIKTFFLFLLSVLALSTVQAQTIELPNACKKILDKNFRGWKLAKIRDDIIEYYREEKLPHQLNVIKGDWNGDGKSDYAALIEREKLKNNDGKVFDDESLIVAFIRGSGRGYKHYSFFGSEYITLMEKGSQDYSYETNKTFRYENDAIFSGYFEKGGTSHIWNGKKFIAIITSD
jgi:hypothetical protein